jgi:pimeloyl-ACP methyl ester carboxylesterase
LEIIKYKSDAGVSTGNLIIFLRGLGGNHKTFEDAGMVDDVQKRNIFFDMQAPNAHFTYYSERTLIEHLHEEVILPAVSKGYKNIWLVGISMGGLGSLLYVKEQPEYVKGIVLISPFLGYDKIITEIADSHDLSSWNPGQYVPDDDWERMLWHWIKDEIAGQETLPIFLGYGREDKYVKGQRLFATAIPEERVLSIDGAHTTATFTAIWTKFLDDEVYLATP